MKVTTDYSVLSCVHLGYCICLFSGKKYVPLSTRKQLTLELCLYGQEDLVDSIEVDL